MARALGIGGVFFKAKDPQRLMQWYQSALQLVAPLQRDDGWGIPLNIQAMPPHAYVEWCASPQHSTEFPGDFSFNFVVDDVDAMIAQIEAHGGARVGQPYDIPDVGRFCTFSDIEGNHMELWTPVALSGETRQRLDAQLD